ncbi:MULTISPECIES: phage holin family protein [unclassified Uliginosibacterium]|jgi:uncharacterized membrane protein YqjE|uniref:phage holin family protein n=1 Tax=unclassified Uliginosibacterium TaxID=2621521 RepID=UPI000C7D9975|nr:MULTISPECIES: phage holin family protein [unclassified Uliginosibacterium]MDO6385663.1 phage holin family protein [Uliginosibacterium sp. 31-12]PLK47628.1 hypothetical protein C0V76_16750 [Uliginosibacterium sp. TH139]
MLPRFLERLRQQADNLAGLLGNRVALFGIELQEESERLLGHLALLLGAAICTLFCLLSALVAGLVLAARYGVLLEVCATLAVLFLLLALGLAWYLRRRLADAPEPFEATRQEFERDRLALNGARETAQ